MSLIRPTHVIRVYLRNLLASRRLPRRKIDSKFVKEFVDEVADDSYGTPRIYMAYISMSTYRYPSMLAGPTSRKMPVAIGTLKNVGYLDRISNRISSFSLPVSRPIANSLFSYCSPSCTLLFPGRATPLLSVSTSRRWCEKRISLSERHLAKRNIHLATAAALALVAHSKRVPLDLHKVGKLRGIETGIDLRGVWNQISRKARDTFLLIRDSIFSLFPPEAIMKICLFYYRVIEEATIALD